MLRPIDRDALRAALLVVALAGAAMPAPSSAEPYRSVYTGNLLVVVEGSREAIERTTAALQAHTTPFDGAVAAPQALFDTPVMAGDACPEPSAFVDAAAPTRQVLIVPTAATPLALSEPLTSGQAWDEAYAQLGVGPRAAAVSASVARTFGSGDVRLAVIEPDLAWIDTELDEALPVSNGAGSANGASHAIGDDPDDHWPTRTGIDWHFEAGQINEARRMVERQLPSQSRRVKIAHFDTGYSQCADDGLPPRLRVDESWDFTAMRCDSGSECAPTPGGGEPDKAGVLRSVGHGTGTLGILAGGRVQLAPDGSAAFDGMLGAAPFADIVEYRLADFVAIWRPSIVAAALRWAVDRDVDVVSMSMGGPPSFALHDAVNDAYCRGVAMFTAAGNNFRLGLFSFSTPRTTVFPARYDRVVSVGGITADGTTYAQRPWRWDYLYKPWQVVMVGNLGPQSVMDETIVAWTPNVPWLEYRKSTQCEQPAAVRLNGGGTSAATPQVAAAAAQWLQFYSNDPALSGSWRSWRKTEAVYRALLSSADRQTPSPEYNRRWFGSGILRAATAIADGVPSELQPRRRARVGYDWIVSLLLGDRLGPTVAAASDQPMALDNMLRTEVAQLAITSPDVAEALGEADANGTTADERMRRRVLAELAREPRASETLRRLAREQLEKE